MVLNRAVDEMELCNPKKVAWAAFSITWPMGVQVVFYHI